MSCLTLAERWGDDLTKLHSKSRPSYDTGGICLLGIPDNMLRRPVSRVHNHTTSGLPPMWKPVDVLPLFPLSRNGGSLPLSSPAPPQSLSLSFILVVLTQSLSNTDHLSLYLTRCLSHSLPRCLTRGLSLRLLLDVSLTHYFSLMLFSLMVCLTLPTCHSLSLSGHSLSLCLSLSNSLAH